MSLPHFKKFKESKIPEYHFEKVEERFGFDLLEVFCFLKQFYSDEADVSIHLYQSAVMSRSEGIATGISRIMARK